MQADWLCTHAYLNACTATVRQACCAKEGRSEAHRAFAILAEDGLHEAPAVAVYAHGAGAAQALLQPLLLRQQFQVHRLQSAVLHVSKPSSGCRPPRQG